MDFLFILNSALLGFALAMDAFSVSITDGLTQPDMPAKKMCKTAGTYAFFQFIMPVAGWFFVRTASLAFAVFERLIPLIALLLLGYLGIKMIIEGIRNGNEGTAVESTDRSLIIQGIATSIDALSTGFAISEYDTAAALVCAGIIAVVTFVICVFGLKLGKTFGTKLSDRAAILGGVILISIGIKIFISR